MLAKDGFPEWDRQFHPSMQEWRHEKVWQDPTSKQKVDPTRLPNLADWMRIGSGTARHHAEGWQLCSDANHQAITLPPQMTFVRPKDGDAACRRGVGIDCCSEIAHLIRNDFHQQYATCDNQNRNAGRSLRSPVALTNRTQRRWGGWGRN